MSAAPDVSPTPPLTRARAFSLAWPMMFANAVLPLAGVVDTAVIAAVGDAADLGGVALGVTLWNIAYWSFSFLRMGTTGLTAQAAGASDRAGAERPPSPPTSAHTPDLGGRDDPAEPILPVGRAEALPAARANALELERILLRALAFALALGVAILVLRRPFAAAGFVVFEGEPGVEAAGAVYFRVRSWGAPAVYASFALTGWLIGMGRTRTVMVVQAVFSAVNIALDLWFVLGLGWGVAGVAAATAIADWTAVTIAVAFTWPSLRATARAGGETLWHALRDGPALRSLVSLNAAMMVRSWALLFGFAWFTNTAARQGAAILAGSHVLLQIVSVWVFVLDAWALVVETAVGRAVGVRSVAELRRAIRILGELSIGTGAVFLAATLVFGPWVLERWIADPEARAAALRFLPYCAAIPLVGTAAWLLDGVFIGATASAAMRNAALAATLLYVLLDLVLTPALGPHGMWSAFLFYYVTRAGTLLLAYPALERRARGASAPVPPRS